MAYETLPAGWDFTHHPDETPTKPRGRKRLFAAPLVVVAVRVPREAAEALRGHQAESREALTQLAEKISQQEGK